MNNIIPFPGASETDGVAQLDAGERLLLWGFRTFAHHRGCDCAIVAAIRQMYAQCRADMALASLDVVVDVFARTAHTPIEVHGPCCPCVCDCEMHLLHAMAAAQYGDLDAARRAFERWLPGLAADWILDPAGAFGHVFQTAGMTLRRRGVGSRAPAATSPTRIWAAGSTARH